MTLFPDGDVHRNRVYYMGLDIAGGGSQGDSTVFTIIEDCEGIAYVVYVLEMKSSKTPEIVGIAKTLHEKFSFENIYVDYTGLGTGPVEQLQEDIGYVVVGVTFTQQSKMDMYSNVKRMMETGKLKIPKNKKLLHQLMDLRRELSGNKKIKIHHSDKGHDDYPDSLALACWHYHGVNPDYSFPIG